MGHALEAFGGLDAPGIDKNLGGRVGDNDASWRGHEAAGRGPQLGGGIGLSE
jgi:hypothetical protein